MYKTFGFCLLAVIVVLLTWNGTNFYSPHSNSSGPPSLCFFSIYYRFSSLCQLAVCYGFSLEMFEKQLILLVNPKINFN